jgi:formylglycine-generating enzyme required for sulfatase activity
MSPMDPEGPDSGEASHGTWSELIDQLSAPFSRSKRYEPVKEIARGGMGAIVKVWDNDLHRHLAMKVVLGPDARDVELPTLNNRMFGRFLDEAQVTGQLDHPGVVPVHDLGVDQTGRAFFTMRLVKGNDLKEVFKWVRSGTEGWNQTRALNVLLKACETLAYAHSRNVVHRDLKPGNIMVGSFGEVYVMDWGLARVMGREDRADIRLRPEPMAEQDSLQTARSEAAESDPGSPLITMDGDVIGTPVYMSPEQARGQVELVDARADVYSMGAILYELLTGTIPYLDAGKRASSQMVLRWVREGAPRSVHTVSPDVPAELEAICERAMARHRAERYADVDELAADLRAYMEGRVVQAYRTGAVVELTKWVQRNKLLAAALAAVFVSLVAGLATAVFLREEALTNEALAEEQARLATERAHDVLRLSALQDLEDLLVDTETLWPPHPDNIVASRAWIRRGQQLVGELPRHRAKRDELRAVASPPAATDDGGEWLFPSEHGEARWWNAQLSKLIDGLEVLEDEDVGLLTVDAVPPEQGWSVARRVAFAERLKSGFAPGGEYTRRWEACASAISSAYHGLTLAPQMALVPIGPDPHSGLWEFWHMATGEEPRRDANGALLMTEDSGAVLVLLPGGMFWMGAQREDPTGRNHDPQAQHDEGPVHEVSLASFFLSKYELTQGQWLRMTGHNPAYYQAIEIAPTLLQPVEQVTWLDCMTWLPRMDLSLPTEAQWEYACRGGRDTVGWTGSERESLRAKTAANRADQAGARAGAPWTAIGDWPDLDDGFAVHAPIGSSSAHAFGLHEVHGNLWEWCLDGYHQSFYHRSDERDPLASAEDSASRVARGGSFSNAAVSTRSACRNDFTPPYAASTLGVRPARAVRD